MKTFTVKYTQIVKGCAVMLLLFHHLFYAQDRYSLLNLKWVNADNVPYLSLLATDARVCVSIFLMLSGYGIYIKLKKNNKSLLNCCKAVGQSLKKVMINFWYVFIVFVPVSLYLGKAYVYQNGNFVKNILLDFLGVAKLFNTPTMNGAWWYMSVVVISYLFAPLIFRIVDCFPKLTIIILLFFVITKDKLWHYTGINLLLFYVIFFAEGMLFAKLGILDRVVSFTSDNKGFRFVVDFVLMLVILFTVWMIRRKGDIRLDTLFGAVVIIFIITVFGKIKYLNDFFAFVGGHSGNMFFAHSFFYSEVFLKDFIYGMKNPILVYLTLFILSLGTSIIIEKIKKVTEIKGE